MSLLTELGTRGSVMLRKFPHHSRNAADEKNAGIWFAAKRQKFATRGRQRLCLPHPFFEPSAFFRG
jgi:hypothetical protein